VLLSRSHRPLAEQVVVVVGASSGIGRAVVLEASARGARVLAASRDGVALATLLDEVADPERISTAIADAADPDDMRAVARRALDRFGVIDTWAHVAGIVEHARFEDHTPEEFRRIVEVDLLGPVHGALAALPHLRARRGALVVVSSQLARRSIPLTSAYCAAKHGVHGWLESLRLELRHEGARVSVTEVLPGTVGTPFFEHSRTRLGVRPSGPPPVVSPERVAHVVLRAAERGGRDRVVGFAAAAQLALQRLSPRLVDRLVTRVSHRVQRSGEHKGPGDGDAVGSPMVGDDRVRGVVTTLRR
jgi:NAD(P)-dependent dehydrogenase (short-subunit alcohol dehydrogenase family)